MDVSEANRLKEEIILTDERSNRFWRFRQARKHDVRIAEPSELRRDIIMLTDEALRLTMKSKALNDGETDLTEDIILLKSIANDLKKLTKLLITEENRAKGNKNRLMKFLACLNTSRNNNNF